MKAETYTGTWLASDVPRWNINVRPVGPTAIVKARDERGLLKRVIGDFQRRGDWWTSKCENS